MCVQAADVAHEGEKMALKTTLRLREDQLQQQEAENRKLVESAEAKYQSALKRQGELSKELDRKDKALEKVQGEAAKLTAKYQSVQHDLAAAEQSRESTEERLRARESEVIVAIVRAHARPRDRIYTDSS